MKKIFALMLSLMLILGCIGSAETGTVSVDATVMGSPIANLQIEAGDADDGSVSLKLHGFMAGKSLDALVKLGDDGLTAGVNGEYFTMNAEDLISLVMGALEQELAGFDIEKAWQDIVNTVTELPDRALAIAGETLRAAEIAADMKIVNVTLDGGLCLAGSLNSMRLFAVRYLRELAADENAITGLAKTGLWNRLGMPDSAAVTAAADRLEAVEPEVSADMLLRFCTDGNIYAEINAADMSAVLDINGECLTLRLTQNGRTETYVMTEKECENGRMLEMLICEGGNVEGIVNLGYTVKDGELNVFLGDGADNWIARCGKTDNGLRMTLNFEEGNGKTTEAAALHMVIDGYDAK